MSKASLARAIGVDPAVVRRSFSAGHVNPTLGTLAEVAAALGLRITVEPLPRAEHKKITKPLLDGSTSDAKALAKHLGKVRDSRLR